METGKSHVKNKRAMTTIKVSRVSRRVSCSEPGKVERGQMMQGLRKKSSRISAIPLKAIGKY